MWSGERRAWSVELGVGIVERGVFGAACVEWSRYFFCRCRLPVPDAGCRCLMPVPDAGAGGRCRMPVAGCRCRMPVAGGRMPDADAGCRMPAACMCQRPVAGCRCRMPVPVPDPRPGCRWPVRVGDWCRLAGAG